MVRNNNKKKSHKYTNILDLLMNANKIITIEMSPLRTLAKKNKLIFTRTLVIFLQAIVICMIRFLFFLNKHLLISVYLRDFYKYFFYTFLIKM